MTRKKLQIIRVAMAVSGAALFFVLLLLCETHHTVLTGLVLMAFAFANFCEGAAYSEIQAKPESDKEIP